MENKSDFNAENEKLITTNGLKVLEKEGEIIMVFLFNENE